MSQPERVHRRFSRHDWLDVLIILCLALWACGVPVAQQRYQSAQLSVSTAERAYTALYKGFKNGTVDVMVMQEADARYRRWQVAQRLFIEASEANLPDVTVQAQALQEALASLVMLATEAKVL